MQAKHFIASATASTRSVSGLVCSMKLATYLNPIVACSVSQSANDVDQPPGLSNSRQSAGTFSLPPGLSQSQQSAAPSSSAGRASASNKTPNTAATSNAVTSAADTLQNSGAAGPPAAQDTEKQLRNLRKKIRQADATAQKAAEGKQLTPEEQEKLHKLKIWYATAFCLCCYMIEVIIRI